MKSKSFLIAVAAFAVTASGAYAFTDSVLKRAGLSDEQIAAFEIAQELKREGDPLAARDVLIAAGIDVTVIELIRTTHVTEKSSPRHRYEQGGIDWGALSTQQFEAFQVAKRAHDNETAHAILVEAGLISPEPQLAKRQQFRYGSHVEV